MIQIERYCYCLEKLVTTAIDEQYAYKKVTEFLSRHIGRELDGTEHRIILRREFNRMVRKLREQEKANAQALARKILADNANDPRVRRYKLR